MYVCTHVANDCVIPLSLPHFRDSFMHLSPRLPDLSNPRVPPWSFLVCTEKVGEPIYTKNNYFVISRVPELGVF